MAITITGKMAQTGKSVVVPTPVPPTPGDISFWVGGSGGTSHDNKIDYVTISSAANATNFGNLTKRLSNTGTTANGASDRGIIAGGKETDGSASETSQIQFIVISTPGDASEFASLAAPRHQMGATSNATGDRAVFAGGRNGSATNLIYFISITAGVTATEFGTLSAGKANNLGATSNGSNDKAVFAGANLTRIDSITITTGGAASDFGDLFITTQWGSAISNGTNERAVFSGGGNPGNFNHMDFFSLSTGGTAADFGNLVVGRNAHGGTSNGTNERALFGGGQASGGATETIDHIIISSAGNATDHGDLTGQFSVQAGSNSAT